MRGIAFACLLLAAGLSACAGQAEKPAAPPQTLTLPAPYEHGRLTTHLQAIANRLGRAAGMTIAVAVLDSPIPNGFAFPDGRVYLTRGLVALARQDEDWADMISHQIAHLILARDQRSTLDRMLGLGQSLLDSLMIWTDESEAPANPALRPFTAAEEAAANRVGLKLMIAAGYDAKMVLAGRERVNRLSTYRQRALGMRDDMDIARLHPLDPVDLAKILADTPSVGDGPTTGTIQVPSLLDGMLFGDAVRAGVIKGQTLLHPGLGLSFSVPKDVKLRLESQGIYAQGANGIEIRLTASDFRGDPSGAVVEWGRASGLRRAERITIAGRTAATGLVRNGDGVPVGRLIALPNEAGQMWRLEVSAPGADAQALTQLAQEISAAARPLTEAERRQTAPLHLRLGVAPAAAELRRRIAAQPVPEPDNLFALLNDLPPGTLPKPGQTIKWVAP